MNDHAAAIIASAGPGLGSALLDMYEYAGFHARHAIPDGKIDKAEKRNIRGRHLVSMAEREEIVTN